MIYTKIYGGLGNQMFQYAAGRALAIRRHVPLALDLTFFDQMGDATPREFLLPVFHINATVATKQELQRFEKKGMLARLNAWIPYYKRSVVQEPFYHFDQHIFSLPDGVLLNGYWQSEKYFEDAVSCIRKEFALREPFSLKAAAMQQQIASTVAVSVHFRRGDYVTNEQAKKVHGVCDLAYYEKAIAYMRETVQHPHFFIFSDDIEWVRKNASLGDRTTYVSQVGISAPEEMILMSMCQHHIVANSSFSWWGAWLNENKDKRVIAPARWFLKEDLNTKDLIPASWIRI